MVGVQWGKKVSITQTLQQPCSDRAFCYLVTESVIQAKTCREYRVIFFLKCCSVSGDTNVFRRLRDAVALHGLRLTTYRDLPTCAWYDFLTHLSTPPRSLKPRTASTRCAAWACAASLSRAPVALRVAAGHPRRAKSGCVSRTLTNAQRVIGHTDAWCKAALARKGAL